MRLIQLSNESLSFPPPAQALTQPNGLLAVGGDLGPERLISAYHQGIFPWFSEDDPILWWSPDPRAILWPESFHLSRSMKRFHRHSPYRITLNQAFPRVISGCAEQRNEGSWITHEVIQAWITLFERGYAKSVEVWLDQQLVGGLYGLTLGQVFYGESMFSRKENASKTALLVFCQHFLRHNGKLIDCQILNPHTASLGAQQIPRNDFLALINTLCNQPLLPGCWETTTLFSHEDRGFTGM